MVRLQWHVEEGLGAFITQNGTLINPDNGVTHATAEIEVDLGGNNCNRCDEVMHSNPLTQCHSRSHFSPSTAVWPIHHP